MGNTGHKDKMQVPYLLWNFLVATLKSKRQRW
jgi:hypothetical protein